MPFFHTHQHDTALILFYGYLSMVLIPCYNEQNGGAQQKAAKKIAVRKDMDEQVAIGREKRADIQSFVERYPFPLHPFQIEAIEHLATGQYLRVVAPTDTGKTLVA